MHFHGVVVVSVEEPEHSLKPMFASNFFFAARLGLLFSIAFAEAVVCG